MPSLFDKLSDKIVSRKARIAVIGLGYVGLPLAAALASKGFTVCGIDLDAGRIRRLKKNESYIPDLDSGLLKTLCDSGRFSASQRSDALKESEIVIVCVPTPVKLNSAGKRIPDTRCLEDAAQMVVRHFQRGQLIILESTTYPGTTEEIIPPLLKKKGLIPDRDFFLAFSPERIDPGNQRYSLEAIPKIVGGITQKSTRLSKALYDTIVPQVIPVSSSRTAEMVKLLENTFRIVNIGLANEFALICNKMGVDVWEVIEAAKSKPFGFMPFSPGPGIGGHCIPSDPHYLTWRAKKEGAETRLIDIAARVNAQMPEAIVARTTELLRRHKKSLKQATVLLLGIAYKKDVNDTRESPAIEIFELLKNRGARVVYHDPWVESVQIGRKKAASSALTPALLKKADCVIITTDHSDLDYAAVVKSARLVFDTRNAYREFKKAPKNVVRL
jgi:UDP-N-acetyl-D-glucosamine dehydrogenase